MRTKLVKSLKASGGKDTASFAAVEVKRVKLEQLRSTYTAAVTKAAEDLSKERGLPSLPPEKVKELIKEVGALIEERYMESLELLVKVAIENVTQSVVDARTPATTDMHNMHAT